VAAGVAALVIVVGAALGLRAATSHSSTVAAGDQGPTAAKKGRGGKGATVGKLGGVHGSDLSVTTKDGRTVTVKTSGSTTVTASVAATLADIKVGDRVTVRGTSSSTTAMTADTISDAGGGRSARGGKGQGGQSAGTFTGTDGMARPAAISLGHRPTFYTDQAYLLLEAYLLDFTGDLYGQAASVGFVDRIRAEERFDSVEALVAAMHRDVETARRVLDPRA